MSDNLDRKLRTALNETRLLILGVQILLGFQFQSFFQDGFSNLSPSSQWLSIVGLALLVASVGFLIVPSMEHQLVESGMSSTRLVTTTSFFTGLGIAPLTASLGLAGYIVVDRHFGMNIGIIFGLLLSAIAVCFWFILETIMGAPKADTLAESADTPLATRIEQLLTEARVIIPGAQALFGFQFIAMLTNNFDRLPQTAKIVHTMALLMVAINIILLMTPASLHRLSFNGADSEVFLRVGSGLVIIAPLFLAAGIAAESYVILRKVSDSEPLAIAIGAFCFICLTTLWYAIPAALHDRFKK